jgi:hypothetical protein
LISSSISVCLLAFRNALYRIRRLFWTLPLEAKFPAIAKAVSKLKLRSTILALRYFVWVVIGASQFCLERGFGKPGYKELLNRRPQRSQRIDSGQQVRRFERELKPRATNNESKLSKIDD